MKMSVARKDRLPESTREGHNLACDITGGRSPKVNKKGLLRGHKRSFQLKESKKRKIAMAINKQGLSVKLWTKCSLNSSLTGRTEGRNFGKKTQISGLRGAQI